MIYLSQAAKKKISKSGLSDGEYVMAALVACGLDPRDAHILGVREGLHWAPKVFAEQLKKETDSANFKAQVDIFGKVLYDYQIEKVTEKRESMASKDLRSEVSKETMLKDLVAARKDMTPGSPEWIKINQQIIDVTQMKKEEVKGEQKLVHFYLPLKCYDCELYRAKSAAATGE